MPSRGVCPSRSCIYSVEMSRHIFKCFHRRIAIPFWFFDTKRYGNIPTGTSLTGASNAGGVGKNRDCRPVSAIGSMTAGLASNNCDGRPCSLSHRLRRVNEYLFITICGMDDSTTKKTEQNSVVRVTKSEAGVTNNRRLCSRYCTVEATDRHETSRGLSPTAELLVNISVFAAVFLEIKDIHVHIDIQAIKAGHCTFCRRTVGSVFFFILCPIK